jgi:hypothetical protein
MQVSLPHNCRTTGIITSIQQTIDVPQLSPSQFTRLHNCAKKGFVLGTG